LNYLIDAFATLQALIYENLVLPSLYAVGFMEFAELAFDATEFVLLGLLQIVAVYLLLRPLEAWFPAEQWSDRRGVSSDVLYTVIHRTGLVPIVIYALLTPLVDAADSQLRTLGYIPPSLEAVIPGLEDAPFVAFLVYLVILDFADYWRHRFQHRWGRWWALHALHHSQRQMSFWADDRNHLLDDVIAGLWFAAVAFLVGVPPGQFIAAMLVTRFVESLSHANVRFGFGRIGQRLLVSPRFHRTHHGVGIGHEGARYGCNFATLFPLWDILFGTANFTYRGVATGIADQLQGRDYGASFVSQQWLGVKRLVGLR
jgi:sterol desaturase/sphingolipid hydroxylase (fatty acid hydroxylase superfamily)